MEININDIELQTLSARGKKKGAFESFIDEQYGKLAKKLLVEIKKAGLSYFPTKLLRTVPLGAGTNFVFKSKATTVIIGFADAKVISFQVESDDDVSGRPYLLSNAVLNKVNNAIRLSSAAKIIAKQFG